MNSIYQIKEKCLEDKMDGQEVKALSEAILSDEATAERTAIRVGAPRLFGFISALLSGVSILFFSFTAFTLGARLGVGGELLLTLIIGETVGGNVTVTASSPQADLPYIPSPQSAPSPAAPQINGNGNDYVIPLVNETPYSPDMAQMAELPRVIPTLEELYALYGDEAPIVLILHTHGTEGYSTHAAAGYRTPDKSENVVAVGSIIADRLNSAGINTIHCDTLFDAEDFSMAYYNASLTVRSVIAEHPSVSYIIDVHRDSVTLPDGTHLPLHATVDGEAGAQLMLVIGTDHGGSGHTGWQDNLSLAARLQTRIHSRYSEVMRGINLRSASFNQQYTKGSMLLEVGTCANTLEEAKISARIFADALICEIIGE